MSRRRLPLLLALALFELGALGCNSGDAQGQPTRANTLASSAVAQIDPPVAASLRDLGADSSFARLIARLSEDGGFFDTDNLISNETSYLHVIGAMERRGVSGGAYIGVGPDQNFSYIASIRPEIVFIVDIRRDNLLQHLFFKALFQHSTNRVEYLALWFGKPIPEDLEQWNDASIEELVEYVATAPANSAAAAESRMLIHEAVDGLGLDLSEREMRSIDRIHAAFIRAGMDLRFTSFNRPPQWYYPTFGQLLLERDLEGRRSNYLRTEDDFQFLKSLQERNRVVPVVGDFAGPHAFKAIGETLRESGIEVSAVYASNVEFYLWQNRSFDQYAENLSALPWAEDGVIIRSYFSGIQPHPNRVEGYYSSQLLQGIESFFLRLSGDGYRDYWDMVTDQVISLR